MAAVIGPAWPSHLAAVPASAEEFVEVVAVWLCLISFKLSLMCVRFKILIGGVYVLAPLVLFACCWPGFEFKRFLVVTAPVKPTTTIRIYGGWWAAAAVRSGRGGGLCGNAPSLIGDLDGTAATAYTNDGRSLLVGEYYYRGGVGG